ncbi:STAS domain-containing protein [Nocardioides sp. Kera G14]|uniref:STAS domain-containing protein n=1 Tax=Nocardioides sp. Kera G14 TaxID=2884264 RepID=UPI001D0FE818|nr:STAS domain-containing protein [Nocardioides sp. Kera G14]UDY25085.1 STAS domain-containing protein [Nocardioides sp. Kera G14]
MDLTITQDTGTLALVGSIDLVSREDFLKAGLAVLDRDNALALDMSGVDFMDSMGIGALVEIARHAEKQDASFTISAVSPRVSRVLEVTGLGDAWRTP